MSRRCLLGHSLLSKGTGYDQIHYRSVVVMVSNRSVWNLPSHNLKWTNTNFIIQTWHTFRTWFWIVLYLDFVWICFRNFIISHVYASEYSVVRYIIILFTMFWNLCVVEYSLQQGYSQRQIPRATIWDRSSYGGRLLFAHICRNWYVSGAYEYI